MVLEYNFYYIMIPFEKTTLQYRICVLFLYFLTKFKFNKVWKIDITFKKIKILSLIWKK